MADSCFLYYITDRTAFGTDASTRCRRLLEKIGEAARAGVDYIQLREKDLITRNLESLAGDVARVLNELRTENREVRTKLFINSRTDVALAVAADGVHLRSDDVSPLDVMATWQKCDADASDSGSVAPLIGISCHSPEEVKKAKIHGASFTVFGPVFEKKDHSSAEPAGLIQLREACRVKIPVLALGGISLSNAKGCLEAGASGIAAIRLFQENDIGAIVRALR